MCLDDNLVCQSQYSILSKQDASGLLNSVLQIYPESTTAFQLFFTAANAFSAAAIVRSMSSSVWASERKSVSNCEGAR